MADTLTQDATLTEAGWAAPRRAIVASGIAPGLVVLVMLAVLATALVLHRRLVDSLEMLQRSAATAEAQVAASKDLLSALKDAEIGQRGFLLTGRDAYLEPYRGAPDGVDQALRKLRQSLPPGLPGSGEIDVLADLSMLKLAEMARTLTAYRDLGPASAIALVDTDEGRSLMAAIRDRLAAFESRAIETRARTRGIEQGRERSASEATLAAASVGVLLLGAGALGLLIARRRLLRARASLTRRSAQLWGAVVNLPEGVAVFDPLGRLELWNDRFFSITGLPGHLAAVGVSFAAISDVAANWPTPLLRAVVADPEPRRDEVTVSGNQVLELWRAAMPDGGQILTVADITGRVRTEAIARQALKMEALGQLTGGVAHDFNNLLQVMSANLELLDSRLTDPWMRERVVATLSGVDRAARLTRHMLAFARRQPLAPTPIDIAQLLAGLGEILRRTLDSGLEVVLTVAPDTWPALADGNQLENAVINLALNARDAMSGTGRLTIEVGNAVLDAAYALRNAEVSPGEYVMIAVSDTGTGMTAEQLGRAIEPFYTTKPEGRGTGLGLSMVYGFAKQSGGHFRLQSEVGRGTTARLYIPRSRDNPVVAEPVSTAAPQAAGETVLVVEDDAAVRGAVAQTLREFGYKVLEAGSAQAAWDLLHGADTVDLLFTDVVMPGQPAPRDLAIAAREVHPGIAVVFTSGYPRDTIGDHGRIDTGVTLISKPWHAAELASKLRAALDLARQARLPASNQAETGSRSATVRGRRVLVVEDDEMVRATTVAMLADLGCAATEAAGGADALALLDETIDVLLVDLSLPDMSGEQVVDEAKEKQPGVGVIITSGSAATAAMAGDVVRLPKPYQTSDLRTALAQAIAR